MATAPFWASVFGFCLIGETIGNFTKAAMLVSFFGVMIIACAPYILKEHESEEADDLSLTAEQ